MPFWDGAQIFYDQAEKKATVEDFQAAIDSYTKAIELDPEYKLAYTARGLAYTKLKEADKAIADYTKAIKLDPKNGRTYLYRARIYNSRLEADKAITDCTMAIELAPEIADRAYYERGWAYQANSAKHTATEL